MTPKQEDKVMKRCDVFGQVLSRELTIKQAALLLNLSYRHTRRLFKRYTLKGRSSLKLKTPKIPNSLKFTPTLKKKIVELYDNIYYNFNLLHFSEMLAENHNIKISYESLRQIMIKEYRHKPKQRKRKHRQRRARMPKAGMMLQMDSSKHKWLETVDEKYWLICLIDDANNIIPYAQFFPSDTTFANMEAIKAVLLKKGVFEILYVDKAGHFITIRWDGLHNTMKDEYKDTNIQMALNDLGITLVTANSPQAKGRVERMFGFFQDRLINEMRLNNIQNYDEANHFLETVFLPKYNKKYNKNKQAESAYKPLPKGINLNTIFTLRETRHVKKDNTISFYNQIIQIPPIKKYVSLSQRIVEVRLNAYRELFLFYKKELIFKTRFEGDINRIQLIKRENTINKRNII